MPVSRRHDNNTFLVRMRYFAVDIEDWNIASRMEARRQASCARSNIGRVHGRLKNFLVNSRIRLRQARSKKMTTAVDYPFSVHTALPKHIHWHGSYTIHACNANGIRHSFGKRLHPEEEAYNVNS